MWTALCEAAHCAESVCDVLEDGAWFTSPKRCNGVRMVSQQAGRDTAQSSCQCVSALPVAQMTVTRSTSRRCVVAADDEVIAGKKPAVELAESKRCNDHDPDSCPGDEPPPGWYLLVSGNGHA